MSGTKTTEMAVLFKAVQTLVTALDRDLPLSYALVFLRIAMAGKGGIDNKRVLEDTEGSSGGLSRAIQALGAVHWNKVDPGFKLIRRGFGAEDNRLRDLTLTPKGERLVEELAAVLKQL